MKILNYQLVFVNDGVDGVGKEVEKGEEQVDYEGGGGGGGGRGEG